MRCNGVLGTTRPHPYRRGKRSEEEGVESPGRPPLAPGTAPALVPRALTPPPRGDPTWARGVCRNILSSHESGSRGVNEASARLVEALLGCTNVLDEFEASKEHVSELEKRLALDWATTKKKHAEELVGAIPSYKESDWCAHHSFHHHSLSTRPTPGRSKYVRGGLKQGT
nr:hypothetical protein Iba_chr01aCG3400 [Ipomoea batatas]